MTVGKGGSGTGAPLGRPGCAGFSLVELMVTLFVLALIATLTAPATGGFFASLSSRKKESAILANLRYARFMAINSGEQVTATVVEQGRGLQFAGGIEETRELGLGGEESLSMDPAQVVFYPEGMATVATVTFAGDRRTVSWWIEPLTGLPVTALAQER